MLPALTDPIGAIARACLISRRIASGRPGPSDRVPRQRSIARVPNKATAERQAAIAASGEAPLDYMIRVMRDESAPVERRDEMAKAAAPYVHPRLAAIEYAGTLSGKPPDQMSDEELMAIIREGQAKEAEERKLTN